MFGLIFGNSKNHIQNKCLIHLCLVEKYDLEGCPSKSWTQVNTEKTNQ